MLAISFTEWRITRFNEKQRNAHKRMKRKMIKNLTDTQNNVFFKTQETEKTIMKEKKYSF